MSLTLEFVRSKSEKRITGLHPIVARAAKKLIDRSYARGVPIVITQGLRTIAEQNALYEQGRTKPGNIVTNAKGGYSNHNFGLAIDFALLMPDGKNVAWTVNSDWMKVVEEAKNLGFAWGGDWKSFKDYPHFEMTFGLTTADYRAGKNPSQTAIDAALKKIGEDEDEMYEELKKQIESLTAEVKQLKERQSMPVPEWAEDAVKAAVNAGLVNTPSGGSYDFYRVLTVLHRAGKL